MRFIGNRSSGRMGFALAERAARRGAEVTVVAANVALARTRGVTYVEVTTAAELAACEQAFPACDVLLMAAAVADYRPAERREDKIKKDRRGRHPGPPARAHRRRPLWAGRRRRSGQVMVSVASFS